ncbi:MAG: LCP family protein [Corynebacterium sp.]|nr:LCP family protein [Corynebacterium sp.]
MDNDYARDSEGNIIRDSLGRPVRRRPSGSSATPSQAPRQQPQQPKQTQQQRPQQQWPQRQQPAAPRQTPPQQNYRETQMLPPQQQAAPRQQQQQPLAPGQTPGQTPGVQAYPQQAGFVQPQAQQPARRAKRRGRKRAKWPLILLVFLLVFVGIPVATLGWADTKLNRIQALPAAQIANTSGTNWLFIGSDSRQGLTAEQEAFLGTGDVEGTGRTDTIMLLHVPLTGKATLVSIPRDSYVNIPGYGMNKINAAYAYGGPQLLVTTVEQSTGLHINHVAEIGFAGFAGLVDELGGIELCPSEPINDPLAGINVQAGCQEMDGVTALGYVRTRATAMGDLDRVVHQREFFTAIIDKLTSVSSLMNPIGVVNALSLSFAVDQHAHIWDLVRVAFGARSGLETTTVPVGGFDYTAVGSVVNWDTTEAAALFNSLK